MILSSEEIDTLVAETLRSFRTTRGIDVTFSRLAWSLFKGMFPLNASVEVSPGVPSLWIIPWTASGKRALADMQLVSS